MFLYPDGVPKRTGIPHSDYVCTFGWSTQRKLIFKINLILNAAFIKQKLKNKYINKGFPCLLKLKLVLGLGVGIEFVSCIIIHDVSGRSSQG